MEQKMTERQKQVLELFLSGATYTQVAAELCISPETVNPHLKVIARKLGTKRIAREELRRLYELRQDDIRSTLDRLFAAKANGHMENHDPGGAT